jgi:hypothetical protein
MSLEILEVKDRSDLKRWVRFVYDHYRKAPSYVPQLIDEEIAYFDPRKNPVFEVAQIRLFLAVLDGRPVGRICGIIHSLETEKLGYKRGRFGWFETIDSQDVADLLIDTLKDWFVDEGCAEMTGPHGFTDLDIEGLLLDDFDAVPTIAGSYNFPYYQRLLEHCGFEKDVDYFDFRFEIPDKIPFFDRMRKRYANFEDYKVVTCKSKKELLGRIDELWPVIEGSFEAVYGVVPLTEKQKAYYTKKYFGFLDPDFVKLLCTKDDEIVAFLIAMPNLSGAFQKARGRLFPFGFIHILRDYRKAEAVDFLLAGCLPGHPTSVLTAIGLIDMFGTLHARGVKFVESNHELENSTTIHRLWNRFPQINRRRTRVFRQSLNSSRPDQEFGRG